MDFILFLKETIRLRGLSKFESPVAKILLIKDQEFFYQEFS